MAADTEHFTAELIDYVHLQTPFDLITPIADQSHVQQRLQAIPAESFTPQWAGYATAVLPYTPHNSRSGPYYELVQRQGERPDQWHFNSFLSTTDRNPLDALTRDYPKRWHLEEFFNFNQALGWQHAGTLNLNVRYGQMTMALLAQAAIHQLRCRLGEPYQHWDANTWPAPFSEGWRETFASSGIRSWSRTTTRRTRTCYGACTKLARQADGRQRGPAHSLALRISTRLPIQITARPARRI